MEDAEVGSEMNREDEVSNKKLAAIGEKIAAQALSEFKLLLDSHRPLFKSVFRAALSSVEFASSQVESVEVEDWQAIESLSQLRASVGGRFENLKKRWIAAGFPLKSHRGERTGSYEVELEGWTELSTWIHKQGFDSRLAETGEEAIFFVRPI